MGVGGRGSGSRGKNGVELVGSGGNAGPCDRVWGRVRVLVFWGLGGGCWCGGGSRDLGGVVVAGAGMNRSGSFPMCPERITPSGLAEYSRSRYPLSYSISVRRSLCFRAGVVRAWCYAQRCT